MKLTKQSTEELLRILKNLERVEQFIKSDEIEVVKDYGREKVSINKHIGSDMVRLYAAKESLQTFIDTHSPSIILNQ